MSSNPGSSRGNASSSINKIIALTENSSRPGLNPDNPFSCSVSVISTTMKIGTILFAALCLLFDYALAQDYPFQDPNLPWDERVDDLVGRLTMDEIIMQLARGGTDPDSGPAPAIPRLGINPYGWNTECLDGDVSAGPATSFPQAIGLAATFSMDVVERMAHATALEVRAKYNDYSSQGEYGDHMGLSCFSPVINIMRHPLWGRNQETYGEDPYLSGQLSRAFVTGLQGDNERYILANAGCKHFDVHGGPENIPVSRFSFDAQVSQRDWRLTFLPAFHECVKAGTYSIMCSYNSINGVPACTNSELLTDILRTEWGFTGYVISDQDAVRNVWAEHHYTPDDVSAAAASLNAGTNIEVCTSDPNNAYTKLGEAVAQGLTDNETIIESVKPLFYTRMRLGEFDPPSMNPYSTFVPDDYVQSDDHQALALEFALKSFVLLKNDGLLPLKQTSYNVISVVGPMADNPQELFGDYSATYDPAYTKTPYVGLQPLATQTNYASGCNDNHCETYDAQSVIDALAGAEIIFLCLGTGSSVESEGNDRADLTLPGQQGQLLNDVVASNNGQVPIVLLLFTASPVQLDQAVIGSVQAIVECFFPAQATGDAVRKLLLNDGDYTNPAARLPFTWETDMSQVPDMTNYTMYNRTYRYWNQGPPTFPFGYGLSYTTFEYSDLTVSPAEIQTEESVTVQARVQNTGAIDGDEVIQVYISWVDTTEVMPILQLVHFERVLIPAGSTYVLNFDIEPNQMAVYEDDNGFVVRPGRINVYVGGQQPNQVTSVGSNVLNGQFTIVA